MDDYHFDLRSKSRKADYSFQWHPAATGSIGGCPGKQEVEGHALEIRISEELLCLIIFVLDARATAGKMVRHSFSRSSWLFRGSSCFS